MIVSKTLKSGSRTWSEQIIVSMAWVVFAVGVYVVLSTVVMVIRSWDPVPYADQWDNLVSTHVMSWTWLFSQHNEHRLLIARLVFWIDRWLSSETNIVDFAANVLIQGGLTVVIVTLAMRTLPRGAAAILWVTGVATSLLFWAVQYENFAWGFQVQFFSVLLAATATFMIVATAVPTLGGTIAAILCEAVALYSLSSGILVPVLALGLGIWVRRPPVHLALLAIAAIALLTSYLSGYYTPPQSSDPTQVFSHVPAVAMHFLAQLGGSFATAAGQPTAGIAAIIGGFGLLLFVIVLQLILRKSPTRTEMIFITLCAFVLAAAGLTAAGRVRFGMDQALSSRYATPTLLFWLALLFLCAGRMRTPGRMPMTVVALSVPALLFIAWSEPRFVNRATDWSLQRTLSIPALLSNVADPRLGIVYPDAAVPLLRRPGLLAAGTSIFADDWTRWLGSSFRAHFVASYNPGCSGVFLKATSLADTGSTWRAVGNAWFATPRNALRRIVLTDANDQIVGYGVGGFTAALLGQISNDPSNQEANWWTGDFSGTDPTVINAYALQENGHDACPLIRMFKRQQSVTITLSPLPSGRLQAGGYVDRVTWEQMKVKINGWGMLTNDVSKVQVDTNLPTRAITYQSILRPDVAATLKDPWLGDSGMVLELDLSTPVEHGVSTHLCIWTDDEKYGRRVLQIPFDPGLCPEAAK